MPPKVRLQRRRPLRFRHAQVPTSQVWASHLPPPQVPTPPPAQVPTTQVPGLAAAPPTDVALSDGAPAGVGLAGPGLAAIPTPADLALPDAAPTDANAFGARRAVGVRRAERVFGSLHRSSGVLERTAGSSDRCAATPN